MDNKIKFLLIVLFAKLVAAGHYIDGYYFSYPMLLNWYEAQRYCTYQGMYFVDIPNDKEFDKLDDALQKLLALYNNTAVYHWIAATRLGSDNGQVYWASTGHPMWFQNWGEGEGANMEEKCVVLNNERHFADADCNIKGSFICRQKYQEPVKKENRCMGF